MTLNEMLTREFPMTPAGTPPLIDIRTAKLKATHCVTDVLDEVCRRLCPGCSDGIAVSRGNPRWRHGDTPCGASAVRDFFRELGVDDRR